MSLLRFGQLKTLLYCPPEPASRVTQVLVAGKGVSVAHAVGGAVFGYDVAGHVATQTGAGEELDGDHFFFGTREFQTLSASEERLGDLVANRSALRIENVGEEAAVDQFLVCRLEFLFDLRHIRIGAYRDVLLQLEKIYAPRRRSHALEVHEPVQSLGYWRVKFPEEFYVQTT